MPQARDQFGMLARLKDLGIGDFIDLADEPSKTHALIQFVIASDSAYQQNLLDYQALLDFEEKLSGKDLGYVLTY